MRNPKLAHILVPKMNLLSYIFWEMIGIGSLRGRKFMHNNTSNLLGTYVI